MGADADGWALSSSKKGTAAATGKYRKRMDDAGELHMWLGGFNELPIRRMPLTIASPRNQNQCTNQLHKPRGCGAISRCRNIVER